MQAPVKNFNRFSSVKWKHESVQPSGFSLGRLHMGGFPPSGGTSAGGQSVNGGTHEGGHRPYGGGPNFDRLYHKLKVMLL